MVTFRQNKKMKNYFPLLVFILTILLAGCLTSRDSSAAKNDEVEVFIDSLNRIGLPIDQRIESIRDFGFSYYNNGDVHSASKLFEHLYDLDSTDISSQYAVALSSSIKGDLQRSIRLLKKVLREDSLAFLSAYGSIATLYSFRNEKEKAEAIVRQMLKSSHREIIREGYSVAAVLAIIEGDLMKAIDGIEKRIPFTKEMYDPSSDILMHPYWDYHLIGNIYLTAHEPDSAKKYVDMGFEKKSFIPDDYSYFTSMYLLGKREYDASYNNFKDVFDRNQNGFAGIWARILIEKNLPDSALVILNKYSRDGYYKEFLKGKAYLKLGNIKEANKLFEHVLDFHQIGEWYWQHEYALICNEVLRIYDNSPEIQRSE